MFRWVEDKLSPREFVDISLSVFSVVVAANVEYWNYKADWLFPGALGPSDLSHGGHLYGGQGGTLGALDYSLTMGLILYFVIPYLLIRSAENLRRKPNWIYKFVLMGSLLSLASILHIGYFLSLVRLWD